jgi:site-specific recombinase XerD
MGIARIILPLNCTSRLQTVREMAIFVTVMEGGMRKAVAHRTVTAQPSTAENVTVMNVVEVEGTKREWLTEKEVDALCDAARARGRWGHRDATMILMAYRHGLRVSELVALRWDQIDLEAGRLHVIRCKGSDNSVQPLAGVEIRALRRVKREQETGSRHVFLSERGAPMTSNGFFRMMQRAAASIGMADIHPHLLRHGCGFRLVNNGVDTRTLAAYLGHRNIQNTSRYTKMDAKRFDGFWRD